MRVPIPHSLFSDEEEDHTFCFFCRSDDKEVFTKLLESKSIPGFAAVISMNDVKKYYKLYKDRKTLLHQV